MSLRKAQACCPTFSTVPGRCTPSIQLTARRSSTGTSTSLHQITISWSKRELYALSEVQRKIAIDPLSIPYFVQRRVPTAHAWWESSLPDLWMMAPPGCWQSSGTGGKLLSRTRRVLCFQVCPRARSRTWISITSCRCPTWDLCWHRWPTSRRRNREVFPSPKIWKWKRNWQQWTGHSKEQYGYDAQYKRRACGKRNAGEPYHFSG